MAADQTIPPTTTYSIVVPDAPDLPLLHVNALNLRFGIDEFFFTLGVVLPPEVKDPSQVPENPRVTAEPVFRFAVSRQAMQKFIDLMVTQFNNQTAMIQEIVKEAGHE